MDRVMAAPDDVVVRKDTADIRDVIAEHRYTPAERGQALAFSWWVYVNRLSWPRAKLRAAIQSISPMMLFSSSFLAEMTGLPRSTVTKNMLKPPGVSLARVTGSCDPWVIQRLLEATAHGVEEYRQVVREITLLECVPKALMSRISGVPVRALLRPDKGMQFFPEAADYSLGHVCGRQVYERSVSREPRWAPRPGDQSDSREAFAGFRMTDLVATSIPVPDDGVSPFFTSIPGLPSVRGSRDVGPAFYEKIRKWEFTYHLPAKIFGPPEGDLA
ncbi:hypothetical protein [Streptomyces sp. 5-10]|uniref:hypothetical protein n=1 Tax=Streptomyces sp. 5-10 TaxID=878925 RepID=UPI00168B6ABB|nr:hypothetical protein [Streptomyces sp. 5-10]MBD3004884.1 hypothetical protein [Streptomyces sp. 5-10]